MGFNCGIVGLPNVGKSTLFNALTATQAAQAANYPFCTIEPNVGIVEVPNRLRAKDSAVIMVHPWAVDALYPLVRRYKAWPLIVISHVMIGAGFLGFPFTQVYAVLVVLAFVMGAGLGLSGPLSTTVTR